MSTKDITRLLQQPQKHYSAARWQQGRPLLDSDYNEATYLATEDLRHALLAVTGGMGSPDGGFALGGPLPGGENPETPAPITTPPPTERSAFSGFEIVPVSILPGTMYVGGVRVVLEQAEAIDAQRDFLDWSVDAGGAGGAALRNNTEFIYYLEVWEQAVHAVEDEALRETALGGPDTSVRIRRMRRVKVLSLFRPSNCSEAVVTLVQDLAEKRRIEWDPATGEAHSKGRLQLVFQQGNDDDLCAPEPPTQYLGTEHRTLRIMQVTETSFVWRLGQPTLYRARVTFLGQGVARVELLTPPADLLDAPRVGRTVEVLTFGALLDKTSDASPTTHSGKMAVEVGEIRRINTVNEDGTFEIGVAGQDLVFVRFWHHAPNPGDELVRNSADPRGPALGNTGIVPVFHQLGGRGDFWVASLRTNDRRQIVPREIHTNPNGVPPHGPRRYFAPLAYLDIPNQIVEDCRVRLRTNANDGCETYTVGDGFNSVGDYTSIQEAVHAVASTGGIIAVRPGIYEEAVRVDFDNITIEGCGSETVVRSPGSGSAEALFTVAGHHVAIRSLRIEADDQRALYADQAERLQLSELSIVETTDETSPPSGTVLPLLQLDDTSDTELRGTSFSTKFRGAIGIYGGSGHRVENCEVGNLDSSSSAPTTPAIEVAGATDAWIGSSRLECLGRVGIVVRDLPTTGVRLFDLGITTLGHSSGVSTREGIDLDECNGVTVDHCEITQAGTPTEHAAIIVKGLDLTVRACRIRSLPQTGTGWAVAWGGIQVRGGSTRVLLCDNQISGGLGHGITLGSVLWDGQRVGGAGAVQSNYAATPPHLTGDLSPGLNGAVASDEGLLANVQVVGNRIEGGASNGISVLTVLGVGVTEPELFEVARLSIERNLIVGNLRQVAPQPTTKMGLLPFSSFTGELDLAVQLLPQAGIALSALTGGATISENHIAGNGSSQASPIGGIFVLFADALTIAGNRVLDNGALASDAVALSSGVRAGISVLIVGGGANEVGDLSDLLTVDADPEIEAASLDHSGFAVRVVNNSVQQPEGRALHLIATGAVSIAGNFLSSQGYHGAETDADRGLIGDVVFVQNFGAPWETTTAGSIDFSSFDTPPGTEAVLTNTASPQLYMGAGGAILFHNNQVTYDWEVKRAPSNGFPLSYFPVAIMGQDHVSVIGNHFALRLANVPAGLPLPSPGNTAANEPLLAHALIGGVTTQVVRNRIAEPVLSCTVSLITSAQLLGITAHNQSTHPTFGFRWKGNVDDSPGAEDLSVYIERGNLVLFTHNQTNYGQLRTSLIGTVRDFFDLLHQRP